MRYPLENLSYAFRLGEADILFKLYRASDMVQSNITYVFTTKYISVPSASQGMYDTGFCGRNDSPRLDSDDRWRPRMAINNIRFYYGFEI